MNTPLRAPAAPRRLLVICHGFPPYYGGAEHVAYYLAREAAADGLAVTALTSDLGGRLLPEETMDGIRVLRLHAPKKNWAHHTVRELFGFLRAGAAALPAWRAETEPETCLAHFTLPAGELARRLKRAAGVPYSVVLHGSDVPGYQPGRFGTLYPLVRPFIRRVWAQAERVIAVSDALRDLALRTWPGGRIEVIRNGVDTRRFRPAEPRPAPAPDAPVRLIVTAQLIERKGIGILLDALGALPPDLRGRAELDVCGIGPCEQALKTHAVRLGLKARFRGLVPQEELAEALRAAQLFVLPSLQEGLPLALLEAMSSGLAVVSTAVGGIPGLLRDGRDALLVPPGDALALKTAIETFLLDPALLEPFGRAARETALAHSWQAAWRDYRAAMNLPAALTSP